MNPFLIFFMIVAGILLVYIAIRVWTYGFFRSYFEALTESILKKKHKEREEQ